MELGIHDMPKFQKSDGVSILPLLPKPHNDGPQLLLNPNMDVKMYNALNSISVVNMYVDLFHLLMIGFLFLGCFYTTPITVAI